MAHTPPLPEITRVRAFIIDLDGVLWIGETPLPGLGDFFAVLRRRGLRFQLVSNNATATSESVRTKLGLMGVEVAPEDVLTTSQATASFLVGRVPAGACVLVIGEAGLRSALEAAGFSLTTTAEEARAVVVGLDRQATWSSLSEAALAIRRGALFLATNPDVTFPIERGLALGSGALVAAIQTAAGVEPLMVGKPEPHLYDQAMVRLGAEKRGTLAVGDRLETDILGAQRAGLASALLLSGVTRREDLARSPIRPDWVFDGLPDLTRALAGDSP
jgi:4-nitrophenyl phosphatase